MKDIKKDFESFVSESDTTAGSSFVLAKIQADLKKELPSTGKVASKLGVAHLLGSAVSLMGCSQFGIQLFFKGGGMMDYFMRITPHYCEFFCGALYLAVSLIVARMMLTRDEWLVIRRSRSFSIAALALVSLGGFAMVSHEVTFEAGLIWLFGAAVGGELVTVVKSPSLWLRRVGASK
ncbi:MAG: hypothetical protein HUU57_15115 [Bdellovibrio sp.]|nr:hypothetical protein [Bdellovibrio sp.]